MHAYRLALALAVLIHKVDEGPSQNWDIPLGRCACAYKNLTGWAIYRQEQNYHQFKSPLASAAVNSKIEVFFCGAGLVFGPCFVVQSSRWGREPLGVL